MCKACTNAVAESAAFSPFGAWDDSVCDWGGRVVTPEQRNCRQSASSGPVLNISKTDLTAFGPSQNIFEPVTTAFDRVLKCLKGVMTASRRLLKCSETVVTAFARSAKCFEPVQPRFDEF